MPATSNRAAILFVPEVTYGVIPATPALQQLRITGESLNFNATNDVSKEIRSDRNRTDTIRLDASVGGDIDFELSMGTFDKLIEAVLCGTFSAPVANLSTIKNGVVNRSFTFQKQINDASALFYQNFTGVRATAMDLLIKSGDFVTGKISLMGQAQANSATQIAGATFPAVTTTPSMTGSLGVSNITENGAASTEIISSVDLKLDNNPRVINQIGRLGPADIALGSFDVSGNIEIYFQNATQYNRMINNTGFALSFRIIDTNSDYYEITLPKIKIENGTLVAGGLDTDMMFSGQFRAVYDTTALCTIQINRFDAP